MFGHNKNENKQTESVVLEVRRGDDLEQWGNDREGDPGSFEGSGEISISDLC